ncbi:ABC transporter substrate-binding protein [Halapricum desulfuricans]|uniref:ABC-type nitrate/sulfonate/bicarbonate transportsystem, periplasmic component n=1 Tax=Halapricum desulfuricans TaxID=2841257 RepID=A0A897ND12_9EURY|nr:ABC transporter substrate-binding protein [Halapricum desulfuricans]QSG08943.1 ABC-type nitrate/sulfonate/bicarbonate transportsystem, periplasmic component [Halapricum desulfuricans]
MMNRRAFLGSLGVASTTALSGCTVFGQNSGATGPVQLAYDAAPPHFQAVVMDREGWFEAMDADFETDEASCNSIVQLLTTGKADIGMIGVVPALVVADSDAEAHVVSASSKNGFVVLIAESVADRFAADSGGFDAVDGRRFTLGTYPKGSVSDITARYWISNEREASLEDVELVHLGGPGAARQALLAGEVDGAVIPEPTPTLIEERTDAPYQRVARVEQFIPGEPAGVTVVRDAFAEKRPDAVAAFIDRHASATQFIHDNPDQAATYMSDVYGGENALDASTARAALDSPATQYTTDPHDITSGAEVLAEYAHRLGKTDSRLTADELFDMSHYDQAVGDQ